MLVAGFFSSLAYVLLSIAGFLYGDPGWVMLVGSGQ